MKVTIVPVDGVVAIDGVARQVDMTGIADNIHAVQWDGITGHIEYTDDSPNQEIDSVYDFAFLLERYAEEEQGALNPYASMNVAQALEEKTDQIKAACDSADLEPFFYNGEVYKSSNAISETVNKINMLNLAEADPIPCNGGYWDNLDLTATTAFTCEEFKSLAAAYYDRADRNYQNFKALVFAAIALSADPNTVADDIAAMDHTTGWNLED